MDKKREREGWREKWRERGREREREREKSTQPDENRECEAVEVPMKEQRISDLFIT